MFQQHVIDSMHRASAPLTPSWLKELSPPQRSAVADPASRVLVLAGAGSGKTRVLVARLAWHLFVERLEPQSILAFSFTRKACAEIEARLQALWQQHAPSGSPPLPPIASTFHAYAWRLIRCHAGALGLPHRPTLLADGSAEILTHFTRFLEECPLNRPEGTPAELLVRLRPGARALVDPLLTPLESPFRIWKHAQGLLELEDLVPLAQTLLDGPTGITLRAGQKAVLVDEYQDIDPIQQQLVEALLMPQTRLSLYGDDDQAIYRWRGSEPALIRGMHARPGFVTHLLTVNYRCKAPILRLAAAVVEQDRSRVAKDAIAHRSGQQRPQALEAPDQPARVARLVRELVQTQPLEHIAILVRDHKDEGLIRRALWKQRIPVAPSLDTPGLRLLTCHAAKGLEFPVVILPFMDHDHFPNFKRMEKEHRGLKRRLEQARLAEKQARALRPDTWRESMLSTLTHLPGPKLTQWLSVRQQTRAQQRSKLLAKAAWVPVLEQALKQWPEEHDAILSEERRLCYVAMTRAQDALYLVCERRDACSIFVSDVPEGLVEWEALPAEKGPN